MSARPQCAHLRIERRQREERVGFVVAEWWECRDCGTHFAPVFGVPEAAPERVRTCGHVQAGECANCHAEQVKRQADSLRRGEPGERCGPVSASTGAGGSFSIHEATPTAPAEPKCGEPSEDEGETRYCRLPYPHTGSHEWAPVSGSPPEEPKMCHAESPLRGGNHHDLCTKPQGHTGAHQRYEGESWSDCTACSCPSCRDREAFVGMQAHFIATAHIYAAIPDELRAVARKVSGS